MPGGHHVTAVGNSVIPITVKVLEKCIRACSDANMMNIGYAAKIVPVTFESNEKRYLLNTKKKKLLA